MLPSLKAYIVPGNKAKSSSVFQMWIVPINKPAFFSFGFKLMHSNYIQDEQLVKAKVKLNSSTEECQKNKWYSESKTILLKTSIWQKIKWTAFKGLSLRNMWRMGSQQQCHWHCTDWQKWRFTIWWSRINGKWNLCVPELMFAIHWHRPSSGSLLLLARRALLV